MKLDVSNKTDYDIAAALRGPDGYLNANPRTVNSAKLLTTAVLRFAAGCVGVSIHADGVSKYHTYAADLIGYVVPPADAIAFWFARSSTERQEIKDFLVTNFHFFHHFMLGYAALRERLACDNDKCLPLLTDYLTWFKTNVAKLPGY